MVESPLGQCPFHLPSTSHFPIQTPYPTTKSPFTKPTIKQQPIKNQSKTTHITDLSHYPTHTTSSSPLFVIFPPPTHLYLYPISPIFKSLSFAFRPLTTPTSALPPPISGIKPSSTSGILCPHPPKLQPLHLICWLHSNLSLSEQY